MKDISMVQQQKCDMNTLNEKTFTQTKISTYFPECVKELFSSNEKLKTYRKRQRKKASFGIQNSSTQRISEARKNELSQSDVTPKRKLAAPIFSDEDDSSEDNITEEIKGYAGLFRPERTLISLNKPSSSRKALVCDRTLTVSTSLSFVNKGACCSKIASNCKNSSVDSYHIDTMISETYKLNPSRITNLNYRQSSAQTSPRKKLRQESDDTINPREKRVNYDNVKIMREFFIKVMKANHLKCLLSDSEKEILYRFFESDKDYQYTCIKLLVWKPIWYNIFKYVDNISLSMSSDEIMKMYIFLNNNNFVHVDYTTDELTTLLNLLSVKDLSDIQRRLIKVHGSSTKDAIISKLLKNCRTQVTLTVTKNAEAVLRDQVKEKLGFCFKLCDQFKRCLYKLYLINTFTNSNFSRLQDFFANVNYFNIDFPDYEIEEFYIFNTPEEFSRYAAAVELRSDLENAVEKKKNTNIFEICQHAYEMLKEIVEEGEVSSSKEPHLERFTTWAQYIYIITSGSKHITKQFYNDVKLWFEYLLAQQHCKDKRVDWYCHLSLIYTTYLKQYETAAKLIITAFQEETNLNEVQREELAYRGRTLNRKSYKIPAPLRDQISVMSPPSCDRNWPQDVVNCKSVESADPGSRRTYIHVHENGDSDYLTVEQTALQHYAKFGYPKGQHCEGDLIHASFVLLFYEIIYKSYVKGTFVSSVQHFPLDMFTKYFYCNREQQIKERLNNIAKNWQDEELKNRLAYHWQQHKREHSLCQIDSIVDSAETLFDIIMCIGRPILTKIFERLVSNYKGCRSGLPDLIIWNPQEKKAKFVEVKSENDKLSIKQKLWINYLMDIGASVSVCHVHSKGSKKRIKFKSSGNRGAF